MFDYRIKTFLTVCDTLNYTKAALLLNLTQPAVSQHIHYLEQEYQVDLFVQKGKQLFLTEEGQLLQQAAQTFLSDELSLKESMLCIPRQTPPVQFGATITIGEFVLPSLLSRYMKQHPRQNLKLTIANTSELIHELKEGKLQLAIVEGYFNASDFDCVIFRREQFIPVCSASHVFQTNVHQLSDLLSQHLLVREKGSGTREILSRSLKAFNYKLDDFPYYTEINSMYAIVQLLQQDAGISFLYKAAVLPLLNQGILKEIPLNDYFMEHDFTFIWNRGSIYKTRYQQFCQELIHQSSLDAGF